MSTRQPIQGGHASTAAAPREAAPLRVLFLTAYPAIGGPLPKLTPLMVDGLRDNGCEVLVRGWSAHSAEREGLPAKLLGRAADLGRIHAAIRTWRPDVILAATSHNWSALLRDAPLTLTTAPLGRPLVLHFHGSECARLDQRGEALFTALSRLVTRRASAVLVLSTEEQEAWSRFCRTCRFELVVNPFTPAAVSPNGDRAAVEAGDGAREPTLLFVGRLIREKGIFELLDAFGVVRRSHPCRLRIVGRGPAEPDVLRRVRMMGLSDVVEVLGYVTGDDLDRAYRSADVFVLPSYREGFPLVVMEAMGYGLPIVTTPIRGCADHLVPGEHALFAPPRDAEALAERLAELLGDAALRHRMGAANLTKVLEFAPDNALPPYADILRSVVAGRRRRG